MKYYHPSATPPSFGRRKYMDKVLLIVITTLFPVYLSGQVVTGISANIASTGYEGIDYGAGLNLSAGYAFGDHLDLEIQAHRYWLRGPFSNINSLSLHARYSPFTGNYLKPYIEFGSGIARLTDDSIFDGQTLGIYYDLWLFKPKLGMTIPSGFHPNIFADIGLFFQRYNFRDVDNRFNWYGITVGLKWKISHN